MKKEIDNIKKLENGMTVVKGDCIVFKLDYIHSDVARFMKKRNENWAHILIKEWFRQFKDTVDREIGFKPKEYFENCKDFMGRFLSDSVKNKNWRNPFMLIGLPTGLNIVIEIQNNKLIFEIWKK